ncbi:MAG: tetratricopeptide repeat protein [Abitibacteriaceae bacterium]|nr:tetratricopeptide repeat protein [Abditibacteriaceae bacterium]
MAYWWQKTVNAYSGRFYAQALVGAEYCHSLNPDSYTWSLYGAVLTKLRRFSEARIALNEGMTCANQKREKYLSIIEWGNFYSVKGAEAEAEKWYQHLAQVKPNDTIGFIYLGGCLASQGKLEEAEKIHRHATTLQGNPDEAFLNLGFVLRAQGRFSEAARAFKSALALDPEYSFAQEALDDVLGALEIAEEIKYEELDDTAHPKQTVYMWNDLDIAKCAGETVGAGLGRVRQAIRMREDDKYERTHTIFTDRSKAKYWWNRAIEADRHNAVAQALLCIERNLELNPNHYGFVLYGMILSDLRRFGEAEVALNRAGTLEKSLPKHLSPRAAHNAWAKLCELQGKFIEEERWRRKNVELAAEAEPWQEEAYCDLGNCLYHQGRIEEAEANFRQALTFKDDQEVAFFRLGCVLRSQARLGEAKQALENALELDPNYKRAIMALEDVTGALEMQRKLKSKRAMPVSM